MSLKWKQERWWKLCETQYNLQCQSRIASLDLRYESEWLIVRQSVSLLKVFSVCSWMLLYLLDYYVVRMYYVVINQLIKCFLNGSSAVKNREPPSLITQQIQPLFGFKNHFFHFFSWLPLLGLVNCYSMRMWKNTFTSTSTLFVYSF